MEDFGYVTCALLATTSVPPQSLPPKWRDMWCDICTGAYMGWGIAQLACVAASLILEVIL